MHNVTRPRVSPSLRIEWMSFVVSTAPVAPIAWPCAIAPPSTLTMSSGSPSSRATTMAMAANASLISTRSMDRVSQPARCSACLTAGIGPARLDRRDPVRDEASPRLQTALLRPFLVRKYHRGSCIVKSRRVTGGDGSVRSESRL